MKKMNKKGFTLIEMLVVIAIIAILVSIVIPVVGDSTERAREARDAANIRAKVTELTAAGVASGTNQSDSVALEQTVSGWAYVDEICGKATTGTGAVPSSDSVTITYTASSGQISFS